MQGVYTKVLAHATCTHVELYLVYILELSVVCMCTCPYECKKCCMFASVHTHRYAVCLHGCTHAHMEIMYICLHISNNECLCSHACI